MMSENIFDKIEHALKKRVGFDDPVALECDEWDRYNGRYKKEHPVMYFVFHTTIDGIGILTYRYVTNPWTSFWYGLRQRFVCRPTEVRIQSLNKWQYHDPSEVLLHANFQVLVDFVEWEISVHDRPTWYDRMRSVPILGYFAPTLRDRESGLKHLDWESKLVYDKNWVGEDDPRLGKLNDQAINAIEKRDLYLWWKDVRPNRPDPMDASGLSEMYEAERVAGMSIFGKKTKEWHIEWKKMHDECSRIEKMYDDEDEANICRLAKIRQSLWT